MAMTQPLTNVRVAVVSRCSRTLYAFRRSLMHSIAEEGARVTGFASRGEGYEDLLREEGIDFVHVPVSRRSMNPFGDLVLFGRLVQLFWRVRPDVVHAFTIKPAIYATLAAACVGVRVRVVTITGLGHAFTTAPRFVTRLTELLYRVALARASVVFFQNREDRELFVARRIVAADKSHVAAGSGVDLAHFCVAPLPCKISGTVSFLMIARLLKEKGVMEYLAAAARLRARVPAARCVLVGGRDSRNPSSLTEWQVEALRTSPAVQWVDEVLDVRPYIRSADVVVLPSYREGMPRSLLEGAAMGRALITTDAPGCRELVSDGDNGHVVPPADVEALAQAMIRLAGDPPAIERFGARARRSVEERFDERVVIAQTKTAYCRYLPARSSAHPPAAT